MSMHRGRFWTRISASLLLVLVVGLSPAYSQDDGAAEWWRSAVFYEVFVRSFYDSDGDGVGDFDGITAQLDYLNDADPATTSDLGVTALWLMPIMQSWSYHGYDVIDYYSVDPEYGTMSDFRALLAAAHDRGIRIIIDLPFNHTGVDHPWFRASAAGDTPFSDWYLWRDQDPAWRGPSNQVVWHGRSGRFYYGLFWQGMPDLNYTNPDVTAQMYDIVRFWLEEIGVDGFRLDGVKHVIEEELIQENTASTLAWMTAFYDYVKSVNPNALLVGEIWSSTYDIAEYVVADAIDIAFEFDLAGAMLQSADTGRSGAVAGLAQRVADAYPAARFGAFLTNHDQNRVIDQLGGSVADAQVAARLLLLSQGVPFIYYGEEIGMRGSKPDERIRTPMQWSADAATGGFTSGAPWETLQRDAAEVNVAAQTGDPGSLLSTYRDMIRLRAQLGLGSGTRFRVRANARGVFSFIEIGADEDAAAVLVLLNLSDKTVEGFTLTTGADLGGRAAAQGIVNADEVAALPLADGGGFEDYQPVASLAPYELVVISLSR